MIELDTMQLPRRVVTALMLRGAELPPLQWQLNPNRAAKTALDSVADDAELLDRSPPLADEAMAAAVRALLYHWNGWPGDAVMYAQVAREPERIYIEALVKRQAPDAAGSKLLFQQLGQHPVFTPLGRFAIDAIGLATARGLKRLREVIAFGEQWEPFAYSDVYEQALGEELDPAGEHVVRTLQCREFELLLAYCLEAATGQQLTKRPRAEHARHRAPTTKSSKKRSERDQRIEPLRTEPKALPKLKPIMAAAGIAVICPSCLSALVVPETSRGQIEKCARCGGVFRVPLKPTPAKSSG